MDKTDLLAKKQQQQNQNHKPKTSELCLLLKVCMLAFKILFLLSPPQI